MELNAFVHDAVERTRGYVSRNHGDALVDFNLDRDDVGVWRAQFTYGRAGYGSSTQAIFQAIANAIEPIEIQDEKALRD